MAVAVIEVTTGDSNRRSQGERIGFHRQFRNSQFHIGLYNHLRALRVPVGSRRCNDIMYMYYLLLNTLSRQLVRSVVEWQIPALRNKRSGRKPEIASHPYSKVRIPCPFS